ncbi:MAG: hypothetical protein IKE93_05960 [Erysipelotrichaceae bacterium]|jgi:hypothetical protein|nr:hypothetical protein [Erysipelotrichaceae bacterium]MBR2702127.1 hypothetical protein [Erysipelotrichaceae bacterium]MBR2746675.1 hypothetical protein [Erysipelotrichaceae bacterium]
MKKEDILNYILMGIIVIVGGYVVIKLIKWLLGLLVAGTSILMILLYAFAPIIIIVLLVMILIRVSRRR